MKTHNTFIVVFLLCLGGCATPLPPANVLGSLETDIQQAVVVEADPQHQTKAKVSAWQRGENGWEAVFPSMNSVIGRNGLASAGEKREGDGRTPSGLFRLERAFGYPAAVNTKLAYAQVGVDDFWVDDPASEQYNTWVKGTPQVNSFERLKRDDHLYKYAAVIEYNTRPVVAGNGSAIFLHVWRGADSSTAGCVALSQRNVKRLLKWLDGAKHPVIVLGDP